jgi:hypothetical protein
MGRNIACGPLDTIFRMLRVSGRVRLSGLLAGVIAFLGAISTPAEAAGLPLIISATVDYTHNTLTINGQNFGAAPTVTLDSLAFSTQNGSSGTQIIANFPGGKTPLSFTPGAAGAQGPAGPAGATGATGAAGPAVPAGANGTNGAVMWELKCEQLLHLEHEAARRPASIGR